jgi:chemotaxis protein methyltransferase CheR
MDVNNSVRPSLTAGSADGTPSSSAEVAEYESFCRFLEKSSGITLGPNRGYLVKNRLASIMKELNETSLSSLIRELEKPSSQRLRLRVVDAMTTNETLWFRDGHPFEILKDLVLEGLSGARAGPIRIWSAASSTGQEPYSISMAVSEYIERKPGKLGGGVEIIATDISPTVLKQAEVGIYNKLELARGLSPERLKKYFQPMDGNMQVKGEIRRRVKYRELNLLGSYSSVGSVDVVFCRNVLIYFSQPNKCEILAKIARVLKPGGYLFLGGSEPIVNYSTEFDLMRSEGGVVYRLK